MSSPQGCLSANDWFESFQPGDNPGALRTQGVIDNGQYRVVLQRTLRTKNAGQEGQFAVREGQFLPFSITTSDGSNGEGGGKRTVMAWYNLYLEPGTHRRPRCISGSHGIVVGVILQFSAYYVTRKNHGQGDTITETRRSAC